MIALKPTPSTDVLSLLSPSGGEQVSASKDGNFLSLFNNLLNQSQEEPNEDSGMLDSVVDEFVQPSLFETQVATKTTLGSTTTGKSVEDSNLESSLFGDLEVDEDGELVRGALSANGTGGKPTSGDGGEGEGYSQPPLENKTLPSLPHPKESEQIKSEANVPEQKQTIVIETNVPSGKLLLEQTISSSKVVTSDLKTMTETIKAEISNFQASDLSSGSITIKIKPSNLGEIVIVMEKDTTPASSKLFDKSTGAPIDIRLVATNPDVRNYLGLIKREVGGNVNVRSININHQLGSVKSSDKSTTNLKEDDLIDQVLGS